jgi:hypothetical protein
MHATLISKNSALGEDLQSYFNQKKFLRLQDWEKAPKTGCPGRACSTYNFEGSHSKISTPSDSR